MKGSLPYIGITGVTTTAQVRSLEETFQSTREGLPDHILHIGLLVNQTPEVPVDRRHLYPSKKTCRTICSFGDSRVMNTLHITDTSGSRANHLGHDLKSILNETGVPDAIQLDLSWPCPQQIKDGLDKHLPDLSIILQVNFREIHEDSSIGPTALALKLKRYAGLITHIVLDGSLGRAIPLDLKKISPYLKKIREYHPDLRIVIVGGLGPDSLPEYQEIEIFLPHLSFDAEGELQKTTGRKGLDLLQASSYLIKAALLLKRQP